MEEKNYEQFTEFEEALCWAVLGWVADDDNCVTWEVRGGWGIQVRPRLVMTWIVPPQPSLTRGRGGDLPHQARGGAIKARPAEFSWWNYHLQTPASREGYIIAAEWLFGFTSHGGDSKHWDCLDPIHLLIWPYRGTVLSLFVNSGIRREKKLYCRIPNLTEFYIK